MRFFVLYLIGAIGTTWWLRSIIMGVAWPLLAALIIAMWSLILLIGLTT